MKKQQDGHPLWSPSLWTHFPALQQPEYPEPSAVSYAVRQLQTAPPLVTAADIISLRQALAKVSAGQGIVLQCGDCAESFAGCREDVLTDWTETVSTMSAIISDGFSLPVLKIGRIAGQYAKPRSSPDETRNGVTLPSYRGDIINDYGFSAAARIPAPERMLNAYYRAAVILNALHGREQEGKGTDPLFAPFYVSHEALLLHYDSALTRLSPADHLWYNCAAHTVWLGDRTSEPSQAHVQYLRGIENPVGIKCGPSMTGEKLGRLLELLDPGKQPGKIMLIVRMGADQIAEKLPPLIREVSARQSPVVWLTDPMHGNTRSTAEGLKTRDFPVICEEIRLFVQLLRDAGQYPGGLHLEMTGQAVTECTGGPQALTDKDIGQCYESLCDPRLNREQSVALARVAAGYRQSDKQEG
ncbi:3-deoxy-7-phosphoheptulonate synthase [Morganella morganii]|uniref:3-deoxy-7-phosphoheptulonate synthase class II n=1 Tax=Morganella morganii TaxID=582 RepID=UPI001F183F0C|nr:3-deoxy-7-phosphoheptulonate synthase [Morganella morganii]